MEGITVHCTAVRVVVVNAYVTSDFYFQPQLPGNTANTDIRTLPHPGIQKATFEVRYTCGSSCCCHSYGTRKAMTYTYITGQTQTGQRV